MLYQELRKHSLDWSSTLDKMNEKEQMFNNGTE